MGDLARQRDEIAGARDADLLITSGGVSAFTRRTRKNATSRTAITRT